MTKKMRSKRRIKMDVGARVEGHLFPISMRLIMRELMEKVTYNKSQ